MDDRLIRIGMSNARWHGMSTFPGKAAATPCLGFAAIRTRAAVCSVRSKSAMAKNGSLSQLSTEQEVPIWPSSGITNGAPEYQRRCLESVSNTSYIPNRSYRCWSGIVRKSQIIPVLNARRPTIQSFERTYYSSVRCECHIP